MIIIWAVVYGNYQPAEIDSLWMTKESAEKRLGSIKSDGDWRIVEMEVGE